MRWHFDVIRIVLSVAWVSALPCCDGPPPQEPEQVLADLERFHKFGDLAQLNGSINAMVVFDDGTGPALYVGGEFSKAGNVELNGVAKWDGGAWVPLGTGVSQSFRARYGGVHAMTVFDDGNGSALYVAGDFKSAGGIEADCIAKWDGQRWSPVGVGADDTIHALAVYDDGEAESLYAAGVFTTATGVGETCIAKLDGEGWSAVSGRIFNPVRDLAVYDDGDGPVLYAGGSFSRAPHTPAHVGPSIPEVVGGIMKWNGAEWTSVGGGVKTTFGIAASVNAMTVFDDGSGPALVIAGDFGTAGGEPVGLIAKWNGESWAPLGSGLSPVKGRASSVEALCVVTDDAGSRLYAGGSFLKAGGQDANGFAQWDGREWSVVEPGSGFHIRALAVLETDAGPVVYAGGSPATSGGMQVNGIARWDGRSWNALKDGVTNSDGEPGSVHVFEVFDDGDGSALYAGGKFTRAGKAAANGIARWDGSEWSALGRGVSVVGEDETKPGSVHALAAMEYSGGGVLYAAGRFNRAGRAAVNDLAKWDGRKWRAVGGGPDTGSSIHALTVFDDGYGPALYAGGRFGSAMKYPDTYLVKWDGYNWSTIGDDVLRGDVTALASFSDHAGPALYVSAHFDAPNVARMFGIGKWDGEKWTLMSGGLDEKSLGYVPSVRAMTPYDDGTGDAMYCGGYIAGYHHEAGSRQPPQVFAIRKWTGQEWSTPGGVLGARSRWGMPDVFALAVFDDGSGPALYVAGSFKTIDELEVNHIARWNGIDWSPLGNGLLGGRRNGTCVRALSVFDDGNGPALFAGGTFTRADASPAANIGAWIRRQTKQ